MERVDALWVVLASLAVSWLSPRGSRLGERLFRLTALFSATAEPDTLARLTSGHAVSSALPVAVVLSVRVLGAERPTVCGAPVLFVPVTCGIVASIVAAHPGLAEAPAFPGRRSLVFGASPAALTCPTMGATVSGRGHRPERTDVAGHRLPWKQVVSPRS